MVRGLPRGCEVVEVVTITPAYGLAHCHECGLRWRMDDRTGADPVSGARTRRCPLHDACDFCDRVEQQCDLTGPMPRVVP